MTKKQNKQAENLTALSTNLNKQTKGVTALLILSTGNLKTKTKKQTNKGWNCIVDHVNRQFQQNVGRKCFVETGKQKWNGKTKLSSGLMMWVIINFPRMRKVWPFSKKEDRKNDDYPTIKVAVFSLGLRLNEEKDGTIVEGVFKWSPWYWHLNDSNGPKLFTSFHLID